MKEIAFVVLTLAASACVKSKFSGGVATTASNAAPTTPSNGSENANPNTNPTADNPSVTPSDTVTNRIDSSDGSIPSAGGASQNDPQTPALPNTPSPNTPDPKLKCSAPGAAAAMQTKTQTITFPARPAGSGCQWNQGLNQGPVDGHVQAAETSSKVLTIPTGEVCEMALESPQSAKFVYDDMLILAIDQKAIFISSADLLRFLPVENGLVTWDFSKVVSKAADFENGGVFYCLNSNTGECYIPKTEVEGKIAISLPNSKIGPLADYIRNKSQVNLNLTVTGDDDDGITKDSKGKVKPNIDCRHSELTVNVKFLYLP